MPKKLPEQVQMIWPRYLLDLPPGVKLPEGYILRKYQPGDEPAFYRLMAAAGWKDWDDDKLRPWLYRVLPGGWYLAVHEISGEIVASCMATHDYTWHVPFCGEVGWTAAHPAHGGKGLGTAVVAAVVRRFIRSGYSVIHLYTEPWRLAALKVYLRLGFVPYLAPPNSNEHWHKICEEIGWPYEIEAWVSSVGNF